MTPNHGQHLSTPCCLIVDERVLCPPLGCGPRQRGRDYRSGRCGGSYQYRVRYCKRYTEMDLVACGVAFIEYSNQTGLVSWKPETKNEAPLIIIANYACVLVCGPFADGCCFRVDRPDTTFSTPLLTIPTLAHILCASCFAACGRSFVHTSGARSRMQLLAFTRFSHSGTHGFWGFKMPVGSISAACSLAGGPSGRRLFGDCRSTSAQNTVPRTVSESC